MSTVTLWIISALVLAVIEFSTGTFYLLVAALAALAGGIVAWLGLPEPAQWLTASAVGILGIVWVYRYRQSHSTPLSAQGDDDPDLGQLVHITQVLAPGQARVQYRGAAWDALLLDQTLQAGAQAYIIGRNGNTLHIHSSPKES